MGGGGGGLYFFGVFFFSRDASNFWCLSSAQLMFWRVWHSGPFWFSDAGSHFFAFLTPVSVVCLLRVVASVASRLRDTYCTTGTTDILRLFCPHCYPPCCVPSPTGTGCVPSSIPVPGASLAPTFFPHHRSFQSPPGDQGLGSLAEGLGSQWPVPGHPRLVRAHQRRAGAGSRGQVAVHFAHQTGPTSPLD